MRWRAAQLVSAMDGCTCESVICALTALEKGRAPFKVGDPARWLSHFSGFESEASGKAMTPWIEILHGGIRVTSKESYREVLATREGVGCHA